MNARQVFRQGIAAGLLGLASTTFAEDSPSTGLKNPFTRDKATVEEGGSLLNQYCSHCHGQWAEQGERPRDLRRLKLRYDNEAAERFWETVTKGRMEKGMPVWKGVLPDETLWKIYTFLESVQTEE